MRTVFFSLLLHAAALSVAASTACSGLPLLDRPVVAVRNVGGSAHLHYEDVRYGYAPLFGDPRLVSVSGGRIEIEQTLADAADYMMPGAPTVSEICHGEEIDLGVLAAGTYQIQWTFLATLGGNGVYHLVDGGGFVWSGAEARCTSSPEVVTTPVAPTAGTPITLTINALFTTPRIQAPTASMAGNTITVTDYIDTEFPGPQVLVGPCQSSTVAIGPLAAGGYTVVWRTVDFGPTITRGMSLLRVVTPRRRTAAH